MQTKTIQTLTRKSTTYGAAIEPTCDIVELVPNAEFRIFVGNISAVCNVTIAYTALIPKRPAIAQKTTKFVLSDAMLIKKLHKSKRKFIKKFVKWLSTHMTPIALQLHSRN